MAFLGSHITYLLFSYYLIAHSNEYHLHRGEIYNFNAWCMILQGYTKGKSGSGQDLICKLKEFSRNKNAEGALNLHIFVGI